jgi:hypothetical protein
MRLRFLALAVASLSLTACWHVVVTSGTAPSPTVVEKPWQSSFLWGLVAPPPLNVSKECTKGVSKVETVHSLPNGLVAVLQSAILFGIQVYTPVTAKVTCTA